ncbi:MAG: hypothetical protein JSW66_15730 [Phycisphaerales bacterium]|nr:MAG: hypothetical protein JSW66_15730 [Phycisphaerales bacterium]
MGTKRGIILALVIAGLAVCAAPGEEKSKEEQNIFAEDAPRDRGRGRGRFELTDEEINRILESLKERDAKKAKELAKLREKDPEKFRDELRQHAREEYGQVVRERIEKWRERRRADFEDWLAKSFPDEAEELARLKETNADLYGKKYDLARKKYDPAFEESRRNPELAQVVVEDLKLQKRRNELTSRIRAAKSEKERNKLTAELEEVVGLRYDLIVRRKQIAYEWLLRRLEDLQNRIRESRAEITKHQDPDVKAENVKQRTGELLEPKKGLRWD